MSVISKKCHQLLLELFGEHVKILFEHVVGENLRLDFYLPDLGLGVEANGSQHSSYSSHFHKDAEGFRQSKKRDARKEELCLQQSIKLISFDEDEEVTKDAFMEKYRRSVCEVDDFSHNLVVDIPAEDSRQEEYRERKNELARNASRERYQWLKEQKRLRTLEKSK